jgi:hypothetical protein
MKAIVRRKQSTRPKGPRGGTTTVTQSGMVKKNLWIPRDEAEALRDKAYRERRSEADIIREGLRVVLERPAVMPEPKPAEAAQG